MWEGSRYGNCRPSESCLFACGLPKLYCPLIPSPKERVSFNRTQSSHSLLHSDSLESLNNHWQLFLLIGRGYKFFRNPWIPEQELSPLQPVDRLITALEQIKVSKV